MKGIFTAIIVVCMVITTQAQFESETTPSEGIDSVKKTSILVYPGFGVGLIRNEIVPEFFINVGFNHKERYEVNLNTNSMFFFERGNDKNYTIYRNTFLNAEFLLNFSPLNRTVKNWNGIGIGYLVESKGQYFKESTMMIYYKRRLRYFAVMPGIMFENNFKEIFPVISIKL